MGLQLGKQVMGITVAERRAREVEFQALPRVEQLAEVGQDPPWYAKVDPQSYTKPTPEIRAIRLLAETNSAVTAKKRELNIVDLVQMSGYLKKASHTRMARGLARKNLRR